MVGELLEVAAFVATSAWNILPVFLLSVSLGVLIRALELDGAIRRAFSHRVGVSILLATAVGALGPFCSCTVIPLVAGLLIAGVPLAPVMAFWVASPTMDPEIFALSVGFLGWPLAVARLLATLILSLGAGYLTLLLTRGGLLGKVLRRAEPEGTEGCCARNARAGRTRAGGLGGEALLRYRALRRPRRAPGAVLRRGMRHGRGAGTRHRTVAQFRACRTARSLVAGGRPGRGQGELAAGAVAAGGLRPGGRDPLIRATGDHSGRARRPEPPRRAARRPRRAAPVHDRGRRAADRFEPHSGWHEPGGCARVPHCGSRHDGARDGGGVVAGKAARLRLGCRGGADRGDGARARRRAGALSKRGPGTAWPLVYCAAPRRRRKEMSNACESGRGLRPVRRRPGGVRPLPSWRPRRRRRRPAGDLPQDPLARWHRERRRENRPVGLPGGPQHRHRLLQVGPADPGAWGGARIAPRGRGSAIGA